MIDINFQQPTVMRFSIISKESLVPNKIVLLIACCKISIPSYSQSFNRNKIKRDYKNYTQKTLNSAYRYSQDIYNKAANQISKVDYSRASSSVNSVSRKLSGYIDSNALESTLRKHGQEITNSLNSIVDTYGADAGRIYAEALDYVDDNAIRIDQLIRKYNVSIGESVLNVFKEYDKRIGETLLNSLNVVEKMTGSQMINKINKVRSNLSSGQYDKEEIIVAVLSTAIQLNKVDKKELTYQSLKYLASNLSIKNSNGQVVTFEDYSKDWINDNAPFLRGTSIAEDPVETLTYVVIYKDSDYILNDMKIINSGNNEMCSISEAIYTSTGDFDQLIGVMEGIETFKDPMSDEQAMMKAAEILSENLIET